MIIKSFEIENFRAFRSFQIEGFSSVNLFVGRNTVGKTALLEAIFLHVGPQNPELSIRVNLIRGMERLQRDSWGWLFHDKTVPVAVLRSTDALQTTRTLRISLVDGAAAKNSADADASMPLSLSTRRMSTQLRYDFEDSRGARMSATATDLPDRVELQSGTETPFPMCYYVSMHHRNASEDAQKFSRLEDRGEQHRVEAIVRKLEPRVRRLSVGVVGGATMIRADVGTGLLLPVPLLGDGISRLLTIALAIADAPGGLVMIDEIDAGLHYSAIQGVWESLALLQPDVQIFATTHSHECVRAAQAALNSTLRGDFSFYRLERDRDGLTQPRHYDAASLEMAMKGDWEVR